MYLRVYPPHGTVKVTAPLKTHDKAIHQFIISHLPWIKKQHNRFKKYHLLVPKQYRTGEEHYFLGKKYLLKVINTPSTPQVLHTDDSLILHIRPQASTQEKEALLNHFYRKELQKTIPHLLDKWRMRMKVDPSEVRIKKMKTKWGTCNPIAKRIWLSLSLIKTPFPCIEYVFVHEMAHLLEANHSRKFYNLMDQFLPSWAQHKQALKHLAPIIH